VLLSLTNELQINGALLFCLGLPDDLVPPFVIESIKDAVKDSTSPLHQYTRGFVRTHFFIVIWEGNLIFHFQGHPRLINALSKVYGSLLSRETPIDPLKEVLVTDGAYEALFCAILVPQFLVVESFRIYIAVFSRVTSTRETKLSSLSPILIVTSLWSSWQAGYQDSYL